MTIEAMKVEGPIHVVCKCDKCKSEKQERFFCERCGKRLSGGIHTCTPPSEAEKQEPVAWVREHELPLAPKDAFSWVETFVHKTPLYTHPQPQREWVGLTDEQIDQGLCHTPYALKTAEAWREGVRWAYHQLKEKNK